MFGFRSRVFGVTAILAAAVLVALPSSASAGASAAPMWNGYPQFTQMTLAPHCVGGELTSVKVGFSWDARPLHQGVPAQHVYGFANEPGGNVIQFVDAKFSLRHGHIGSWSRVFNIPMKDRKRGADVGFQAEDAKTSFVWSLAQQNSACSAVTQASTPKTAVSVRCNGDDYATFNNRRSSHSWGAEYQLVYGGFGFQNIAARRIVRVNLGYGNPRKANYSLITFQRRVGANGYAGAMSYATSTLKPKRCKEEASRSCCAWATASSASIRCLATDRWLVLRTRHAG